MSENDTKKAAILESLQCGSSNTEAYEAAGVKERTFYRWCDKPDFFKQCEAARELGNVTRVARVVDVLYLKALKGDLGAICFYLKNRASKNWKEKQELTLDEDTLNIIRLPAKKPIGTDIVDADASKSEE